MKPGYDLDALVAEKVLGWIPSEEAIAPCWDTPAGLRTWEPTSFGSFQPSVDIAAAFEVAEATKLFDNYYLGKDCTLKRWAVLDFDYAGMEEYVTAETPALAICLAVLKLRGIKE